MIIETKSKELVINPVYIYTTPAPKYRGIPDLVYIEATLPYYGGANGGNDNCVLIGEYPQSKALDIMTDIKNAYKTGREFFTMPK